MRPADVAKRLLSPTQYDVFMLIRNRPYGACRRTFAQHDIFEVANRVTEIERRLGIRFVRLSPCPFHKHRRRFTAYRMPEGVGDRLIELGAGLSDD